MTSNASKLADSVLGKVVASRKRVSAVLICRTSLTSSR